MLRRWSPALRVVALAGLLCLGPVTAARADDPAEAVEDAKALPDAQATAIAALVHPYVAGEHVVGLAIGVIDGEREGRFGFGTLGLDDPRVPDADTLFEIGSISKVFTGILLAHAAEDGTAELDDPVAKHVPEGTTVPQRGDQPITLEHLSTHSSGLPRMPSNFAPKDPADPYAGYDGERLFAFLKDHELRREPGAKYEYSNLAVGLLGQLLGARTGGYGALLHAKITKPLGMSCTVLSPSEDLEERLAAPHGGDTTPNHAWHFDAFAGAGAIRSTVNDMLTFLRANLEPSEGALGNAMKTAARRHREGGPKEPEMGLGWHIGNDGRRWHNGQTGGYHAYAAFDADRARAVVVLTNTANGHPDKIGDELFRLLDGQDVRAPALDLPETVGPEVLERYVGTYALSPAFKLTVDRVGSRLFVQATGQPRFRVFPESDTEFKYRVVEARILFEADGDGRASKLVLSQGGVDMPGTRE